MWRSVPPSSCRCSRKYSVLAKLETSFFCVGGEGNSRRVCACERECVCVWQLRPFTPAFTSCRGGDGGSGWCGAARHPLLAPRPCGVKAFPGTASALCSTRWQPAHSIS